MTPLVAVELICAAFVSVLIIRQIRAHDASGSARWLLIDSVLMLCWLLVDASAYMTQLQYAITLLAYVMGSVVMFFYLNYLRAYLSEKGASLNPWLFRIPQAFALFCAASAAVEFVSGRIVEYENGRAVAINAVPAYFILIFFCIIAFTVAVAISRRKILGRKAVACFCIYSFSVVLGMLTSVLLGDDYTVALSAVALMIIVTFLQKHESGFRPENAFAGVTAIIIFALVIKSGALKGVPQVEARPDNCYSETLRVVTDADYLPYSFYDADGKESGHDVELINMLANEMHMNLDLRLLPWDEAIREAENGGADVLMTCDYSDSFEGVDALLKTDPVSADEFIVYSKHGIASVDALYESRCAVMKDGNVMPQIRMLNLADSCLFYSDNREAMTALENGEADCAIMRYTVGEALLRELGFSDISGMLSVGKAYMCFGIGADNGKLLNRLNDAIKALKRSGELGKLEDKWLTTFIHPYTLREVLTGSPWMAAVIILSAAAAVFSYLRGKRRLAEAEAENSARRRTRQIAEIAGDVSSYIINPKTGRFQIFKQAEYLAGRYTPAEDYAESFGRYVNDDVYGPDRETVREATRLPALLKRLEEEGEYRLAFRDISSGSPRWYELRAAKLSEEEILLGFSDINEEYSGQIIFNRMKDDYFALVYVYLDFGTAHAIKDEPGLLIGEGGTVPYASMMAKIVSTMRGETKEYFERLGSIGYLKEKFEIEDKAEFNYLSDYTGEEHWINLTQLVLERDAAGRPAAVAFGFRVLDEETKNVQKLQMEIAEQQKQLAKALAAEEEANRAKTDFLFNMSHDIRTPMNAIIGFTNMAKKEIDDREKALDCLGKVQVSSDILLNLINDVLDMSRIESGKAELHEEKYELVEAFDSFEPAMASLAAAKEIDLQFSIGSVRDRFIFADGPRFDRVLINIISNAIKYTPAGGFVRVSAEQIEDTQPGYGNYRFTVADSGIGMSEEFQKHMFENFTREYNSTTSGIQGTGLGLALAKKLVDLMGGSISCVSAQGVGTTFTIDFPFRLQTAEDMNGETEAVQKQAHIDLSGRRVLLVEDNELNREIAEEILTDEGITVEPAFDGQMAVNMVRERGAGYYDFILMDIQMPVMNGYEATRTIRRMMPELKAPIIAVSANAFAEDRKKSLEAGMDDHVSKPIDIEELIGSLAKFL